MNNDFNDQGHIILGNTIETEKLVDCPTCSKPVRWRIYTKANGRQTGVMLTYCKCEWQGKRKKRVRRGARV